LSTTQIRQLIEAGLKDFTGIYITAPSSETDTLDFSMISLTSLNLSGLDFSAVNFTRISFEGVTSVTNLILIGATLSQIQVEQLLALGLKYFREVN